MLHAFKKNFRPAMPVMLLNKVQIILLYATKARPCHFTLFEKRPNCAEIIASKTDFSLKGGLQALTQDAN